MANLKFLKCVSLYSCLVVLILAFTVIIQSLTTSANAGAPLYSCPSNSTSSGSGNDDNLYIINPDTGATIDSVTVTLAGQTVRGCNGLAKDPTTGTCWIMINIQSNPDGTPVQNNRILATIDESTGVATQVGIPGQAFASIAFDSSGTLFGVTGDGATPAETLYTLSKTTATPTFFQTLGNGIDGEAIAFNPNNGLMYHYSGLQFYNNPATGKILETINLGNNTITNILLSSLEPSAADETTSMVHDSGNTFLFGTNEDDLWFVTPSGEEVFIGDMDHTAKGLAFDCGGEPDPEPPSGPIVIIPTMGQWGMIIATILVGFFAIIGLRRRIKS